MQRLYAWLAVFAKNALAFIAGGSAGVFAVIVCAEPLLRYTITKDVGLGIIALAPVALLLYIVLFGFIGSVLGVLIYNVIRIRRRAASR